MELSENKIFIGIAVLVLAIALLAYVNESISERSRPKYAATTTIQQVTTSIIAAASTTIQSTTMPATTTLHDDEHMHTENITITIPTTTISSPKVDYFSKFRGKGYRQAYMNITYYCPSCVPVIAHNLANTNGLIAKSMAYRQKVSWYIYDPAKVNLETIRFTAEGTGEAIVLNDTEL